MNASNYLNWLPDEIFSHIIGYLSSKTRAELCTVSKVFCRVAISTSRQLSGEFGCFYTDYWLNRRLPDVKYTDINFGGDYHLLSRVKDKNVLSLNLACIGGCEDVAELAILHTNEHPQGNLKHVCSSGRLGMARLLVKYGATGYYSALRNAYEIKNRELILLMAETHGDGLFGLNSSFGLACINRDIEVMKILYDRGARVCSNCRIKVFNPDIHSS